MIKIKSKLSIVTACYNEEKNIKKILTKWINYFKRQAKFDKFEIVITDDGSTDQTVRIIKELKKKNKEIMLFEFKKNKGASAAFTNSVKKSKYEYILVNDSDGQFPIENFNSLWKELSLKNKDAVIGARNRLKEFTFVSLGSFISGKIMSFIYQSKIKDFNCAFKLIKSNIIKKNKLEAIGMNYSTEMTAKIIDCGSNISSVNITHNKNKKKKKYKIILKDSINRMLFVIYLIFRRLLMKLNIIS